MAPSSSRRRRRPASDDEDNDDQSGGSSQGPDSPKRQRLVASDSEDETTQQDSNRTVTDSFASGNDPNDFQPGAIIRVSVQNFVTYEKAEFLPGPHLNMIVGPNGTGKSSLVCAICLGLGYSPKHLGRAGSVKEFVKHGKDTATIEIELCKRPKDARNFIIKVQIRREQNSQKWWLNGKDTTHKQIQNLMRKFKIQVDNLCQFLPQDRVVEFAACTPIDLLRETLRAAAPEEMLMWQRQLRELHQNKKEVVESTQTDADTLKNLEGRQQGLQADVDRIREREEILEMAKNLKSALVLAKYQEIREQNSRAKQRKREAERSLRRLEEESGPSLVAVNEKQQYALEVDNATSARKQGLREAEDVAKKLAVQVSRATDTIKDFDAKIEAERKDHDAKRRDLGLSRQRITALQGDLKNRPDEFNPVDFNRRVRGEEHKMRELEAESREVTTQGEMMRNKGKELNMSIKRLKDDLESFNTQQGQQMNFMKRNFPEIAEGWEWVANHQDHFEKEVFGPPLISCSMKDEQYSDQVQSLLQMDDFTCFTAQTKGDYKKLTEQLYRVMSLSVVIRTCAQPLENFRRPVGEAEARDMGLEGFAIDFLEGPSPVLAMLCSEKRLHLSGVSLREHNDGQYDRLVRGGSVSQWAAGKQLYIVRRRREYGPQAMTAITKRIQPGRFWTSQPVDHAEKKAIGDNLKEVESQREALGEQYQEVKDKLAGFHQQRSEIEGNIERIKHEKSTLQREYQKWQALPVKIEAEERSKAGHEEAMRAARKNIIEIGYEWDAAAIHRAEVTLRYKAAIERIRGAHRDLLEAEIRKIEAASDVQGLKHRNSHIMESLESERLAHAQAAAELSRTKDIGRQLSAEVTEVLAEEPDKRDLFSELAAGKPPAEVEMEIEAELAKLELIHAANPNVIREFERRAQEITRLQRKMEGSTEKLEELDRNIGGLMAKWEPQLDQLVSKINDAFAYNFEQISCAGEVRVHKPQDFDAWALDIMVRFRENETLQQLTAHRQSGGERAVSTIFFLMALQSMAQSPFRVVDEINQGMDPRNERMVHERMVEIACREHTSQYFLITPKLLTGLRYDPKMRVLCIASGEHMPREGRKLDFRRCLKIQKGLMAAAA